MNDEFEKVRKLIRLKRHESTPSPDYVERLVDEFQRRQRAELLKQPTFGSFMEQLRDLFFASPGFRYASATAAIAAIAAAAWLMMPGEPAGAGQIAEGAKGKGGDFSIMNVRLMEVQDRIDIEPNVLAQEIEKAQGDEKQKVVIVPTGEDTGIAVPAGVFIQAYEEASGK